MRRRREKAGEGGYLIANSMGWKGFFLRQASVFPHVPPAVFEKGSVISYLSGTGFPPEPRWL
jgi:hypothetical protein